MDDDGFEIVPAVRIESPCVNVCDIDPASGLCAGCARTIDEIVGWSGGTPEWRAAVMAELPGRTDQLNPPGPALPAPSWPSP